MLRMSAPVTAAQFLVYLIELARVLITTVTDILFNEPEATILVYRRCLTVLSFLAGYWWLEMEGGNMGHRGSLTVQRIYTPAPSESTHLGTPESMNGSQFSPGGFSRKSYNDTSPSTGYAADYSQSEVGDPDL